VKQAILPARALQGAAVSSPLLDADRIVCVTSVACVSHGHYSFAL
jgi:hypothetical protein